MVLAIPAPAHIQFDATAQQGHARRRRRGFQRQTERLVCRVRPRTQSSVVNHEMNFVHWAETSFQKARPINISNTMKPNCCTYSRVR